MARFSFACLISAPPEKGKESAAMQAKNGCKNLFHVHVMGSHQECVSMFFSFYSGVLYNIRYTIPVCSFNELLQAVVKVLAQVLDVNCFDVIGKLLPEPTKVKCNLL